MSKSVANIKLDSYSLEELGKLIDLANAEIKAKQGAVVKDLRAEMALMASEVGLNLEDVIGGGKGRKASRAPAPPKFRNPADATQTWSGRGKRPRWLANALLKGAKLDSFLI